MPSMDVFDTSGHFSMRSLTATVNEEAYLPGQVSSLGLFEESGVTTTLVSVERNSDTIALVPTTPRGGPGSQNTDDARSLVPLAIPHLQLEDTINADEVQGVRDFGSESAMKAVQTLVNQKVRRMGRNMDLTMEYHRLGALKGIVLDADGSSTLFNFYTLFGESAPSTVNFAFATDVDGALRTKISGVIRTIQTALGGLPYTRIHCLCGSTFYDALHANAEWRETHLQQEGQVLRAGVPYSQTEFAGVTFEEYRGPASGPTYIGAAEARFVPLGVPGLFETRYAPADYFETVNTVGIPKYSQQIPDANAPNRRRIIEVQSNPIHMCTRPRVLVQGAAV